MPPRNCSAITEQAGVNLAAVNYHFGSKDALIFAVFDRFVVPMNEERLQLLDEAESGADPDGPPLESVVSAFLHPVVRNWERGDRWPRRMKLMARAMIELGPKSTTSSATSSPRSRGDFFRHWRDARRIWAERNSPGDSTSRSGR
jgi:AcrR family transcriptional regulator